MHYDPIKRTLGGVFSNSFLRKLFYNLLDLLLLRTWHIHRELRAWMKNNSGKTKILDAGMGFGQYSFYMSKKLPNSSILAVDVKQEQVDDCTRFFKSIGKTNVEFAVADLVKYNKPDTYNLILSVDVMEHILEDVEVFRNFHSSLKKDGMLLISTPSDQGGSDVHSDGETSFIEEHVRDAELHRFRNDAVITARDRTQQRSIEILVELVGHSVDRFERVTRVARA